MSGLAELNFSSIIQNVKLVNKNVRFFTLSSIVTFSSSKFLLIALGVADPFFTGGDSDAFAAGTASGLVFVVADPAFLSDDVFACEDSWLLDFFSSGASC